MAESIDRDNLPQATVVPKRGTRISIVWIIPILAAVVAIGIAIQRVLSETGLPPACLDLEITESIAMQNVGLTGEVLGAVSAAEAVLIAPSNPIVSIGPILEVPGLREALDGARARGVPVVAISGIVAGKALKGPADRMLASLGHEASALGVARLYRGLIDAFVVDTQDADLAPQIEALGVRAVVTDTIMGDDDARARLAREALAAAGLPVTT